MQSKGTISEKVREGQLSKADLPDLLAMLGAEKAAAKPATFLERAALLEALFQHYPAMPVGDGLKQFLRDWHDDVGHLPARVLADACKAYRRSKAQFRPTPGVLLSFVDANWTVKQRALERVITVLGGADTGVDKGSAPGV